MWVKERGHAEGMKCLVTGESQAVKEGQYLKRGKQRGSLHRIQMERRVRSMEYRSERYLEFSLRITIGHFLVIQGTEKLVRKLVDLKTW